MVSCMEILSKKLCELINNEKTMKVVATIDIKGEPFVEFKKLITVNDKQEILIFELFDNSDTNKNLTNSIWFDKIVSICVLEENGLSYHIKGKVERAIISGREFQYFYEIVQKKYPCFDLSTVWIIIPQSITELTIWKRQENFEKKHPSIKHLDRIAKKECLDNKKNNFLFDSFKLNNETHLSYNDLNNFTNFIFNQIKMQQEVRDRWFGHYLSIVGGVVAFSTFTLSFFDDVVSKDNLCLVLSFIFFLTGILGTVFYFLFLNQRKNYQMHYKLLKELQKTIVIEGLKKSYDSFYNNRLPFKKLNFGADFYASLIQNIINTACYECCIFFILTYLKKNIYFRLLCCLLILVVLVAVFQYIYYLFEKHSLKKQI